MKLFWKTHWILDLIVVTVCYATSSVVAAATMMGEAPPGGIDVNVVNPTTNPVPIESIEPAEIFSLRKGVNIGTSSFARIEFDLPEGKRLVIETITATAVLPVGRKVSLRLVRKVSNQVVVDGLSIEPQGVMPEPSAVFLKETYASTHSVRLRADGSADNDEVAVSIITSIEPGDNPTNNEVYVTISGYLVDL